MAALAITNAGALGEASLQEAIPALTGCLVERAIAEMKNEHVS